MECGAVGGCNLCHGVNLAPRIWHPYIPRPLKYHLFPVVAMDSSFVAREQDRMLRELTEFLRIPSVSTYPDRAGDCRRAAGWLASHLLGLGCHNVELIEGQGHPVVWGESPHVEGRPTLLIYGHYDVQPPEPLDEWVTPAFEPAIRDGKVYARGACDDKGQVYCLLKAYESVLDANRTPPLNVHFIFEGEEECGGSVISDLLVPGGHGQLEGFTIGIRHHQQVPGQDILHHDRHETIRVEADRPEPRISFHWHKATGRHLSCQSNCVPIAYAVWSPLCKSPRGGEC